MPGSSPASELRDAAAVPVADEREPVDPTLGERRRTASAAAPPRSAPRERRRQHAEPRRQQRREPAPRVDAARPPVEQDDRVAVGRTGSSVTITRHPARSRPSRRAPGRWPPRRGPAPTSAPCAAPQIAAATDPSSRSAGSSTPVIVPMNRLRLAPSTSAASRSANRVESPQQLEVVARGPCRTRCPGRSRAARRRARRTAPPRPARGDARAPRRRRRRSEGRPASSVGRPACASGPSRRGLAHDREHRRVARRPSTSFTTCAPAVERRLRDLGPPRVDADRRRSGRAARTPSITGTTRSISSSTGTGAAPGRVDSPPTSTRSAPSSARRAACATAVSRSTNSPPSLNESGRDVHHAHHERASAERERQVTTSPGPTGHPVIVAAAVFVQPASAGPQEGWVSSTRGCRELRDLSVQVAANVKTGRPRQCPRIGLVAPCPAPPDDLPAASTTTRPKEQLDVPRAADCRSIGWRSSPTPSSRSR